MKSEREDEYRNSLPEENALVSTTALTCQNNLGGQTLHKSYIVRVGLTMWSRVLIWAFLMTITNGDSAAVPVAALFAWRRPGSERAMHMPASQRETTSNHAERLVSPTLIG